MRMAAAIGALALAGCSAESAIHECSLEAAKAIAAAPVGADQATIDARHDRVFNACMSTKGYRRTNGGSDLMPDYVKRWERDWPGREVVDRALRKK